eukprot:UN1388
MLQVFKNGVVTDASIQQAEVRQRELDFYTGNYWTWGGTAAVMAGFVFSQLTNPVPEGTNFYLETAYLVFTSLCLGLDLCIITWTVLCCIWGPGLALRGPDGMKSFHATVDFLRTEQQEIFLVFTASVLAYFGSSCCLVWVYPSRGLVNCGCMGILFFFLVAVVVLQVRLEFQIGGSVSSHEGADGRINGLRPFEELADLDNYMTRALPQEAQASAMHSGMYASNAPFLRAGVSRDALRDGTSGTAIVTTV